MKKDEGHNAQRYRRYRSALPISIVGLLGLAGSIAFKMEAFDSSSLNNGGFITIVSASPTPIGGNVRPQEALNSSGFGNRGQPLTSASNTAILPHGSPISLLHESIMAENKDTNWGKIASQQINEALSSVRYVSNERKLACGTIRCELSIKMDRRISDTNADFVSSRFYTIPNADDGMGVIVEGVFPTVDSDGTKRLNVVYMRH